MENLNRTPMADEAQIFSVTVKDGVPANGSPLNGSPNMSWRLAKKALIQTSDPAADGESATSSGSLEGADPKLCITLLEGLNFTGLKARLKAAYQTWIEQFITIGGIPTLFDALEALGKKGFSSIVDAIVDFDTVQTLYTITKIRMRMVYTAYHTVR